MKEEARYALLELRRRVIEKRHSILAPQFRLNEFDSGMDYAFTLAIIEIDRMLDEEND